jgi:hypothetical protein
LVPGHITLRSAINAPMYHLFLQNKVNITQEKDKTAFLKKKTKEEDAVQLRSN